jgi:hypothetical protein
MSKLARFFLYCTPLSVLIVLNSIYFPFIGGKYYFFRLVITLAAMCLFIGWAFFDDPRSIKDFFMRTFRTPVGKLVTIFAGVFVLACIFAYDPHIAFWSNFERAEGGFQMIHYYAFFVLLVGFFASKKQWRWLFGVSLVAAVGMTLYGILSALSPGQFLGTYGSLTSLSFWQRLISPNGRFQGSLGNSDYVAPYLMFAIFYAAWLWAEAKHVWKRTILYAALIVWFLIFLVLSGTRGGLVGLAAAVLALLIYLAFSRRELRLKAGIVVIVLAVLGGGLFFFRTSSTVKALPGSRLLQISFTDRTFQVRVWNWETAWKGFKERPVLGWGPENYPVVFDKHFDTRHFIPNEGSETWYDRAHSVIFDYLVETGILGLLAYLGMFVAFFMQFGRWVKRRGHETAKPLMSSFQEALLLAMPVGYLVQGLALFDVLPTIINLMIFLAFSVYLTTYATEDRPARS